MLCASDIDEQDRSLRRTRRKKNVRKKISTKTVYKFKHMVQKKYEADFHDIRRKLKLNNRSI